MILRNGPWANRCQNDRGRRNEERGREHSIIAHAGKLCMMSAARPENIDSENAEEEEEVDSPSPQDQPVDEDWRRYRGVKEIRGVANTRENRTSYVCSMTERDSPHQNGKIWMGRYFNPRAAAMAHDIFCYYNHRDALMNFPENLPLYQGVTPRRGLDAQGHPLPITDLDVENLRHMAMSFIDRLMPNSSAASHTRKKKRGLPFPPPALRVVDPYNNRARFQAPPVPPPPPPPAPAAAHHQQHIAQLAARQLAGMYPYHQQHQYQYRAGCLTTYPNLIMQMQQQQSPYYIGVPDRKGFLPGRLPQRQTSPLPRQTHNFHVPPRTYSSSPAPHLGQPSDAPPANWPLPPSLPLQPWQASSSYLHPLYGHYLPPGTMTRPESSTSYRSSSSPRRRVVGATHGDAGTGLQLRPGTHPYARAAGASGSQQRSPAYRGSPAAAPPRPQALARIPTVDSLMRAGRQEITPPRRSPPPRPPSSPPPPPPPPPPPLPRPRSPAPSPPLPSVYSSPRPRHSPRRRHLLDLDLNELPPPEESEDEATADQHPFRRPGSPPRNGRRAP